MPASAGPAAVTSTSVSLRLPFVVAQGLAGRSVPVMFAVTGVEPTSGTSADRSAIQFEKSTFFIPAELRGPKLLREGAAQQRGCGSARFVRRGLTGLGSLSADRPADGPGLVTFDRHLVPAVQSDALPEHAVGGCCNPRPQ